MLQDDTLAQTLFTNSKCGNGTNIRDLGDEGAIVSTTDKEFRITQKFEVDRRCNNLQTHTHTHTFFAVECFLFDELISFVAICAVCVCVEVADEDAKLTGGTAVQNNWGFYQSAQGYPQVNLFFSRGKKGWVVKGHLKLGKQKLKYFRYPNHRKVRIFCFVVVFFIHVYRHRCVSGIRDKGASEKCGHKMVAEKNLPANKEEKGERSVFLIGLNVYLLAHA